MGIKLAEAKRGAEEKRGDAAEREWVHLFERRKQSGLWKTGLGTRLSGRGKEKQRGPRQVAKVSRADCR